jgi:hypothetical protein
VYNKNNSPEENEFLQTKYLKKEEKMNKIAILLALFVSCTMWASADTLTLTGTGSGQTDGVYTYPYYLSYNGGPSLTMMCLSSDKEIYQGETWNVTSTHINGTLDEEAAWLFVDAQKNPTNDVNDQVAAWNLFANNIPMTAGSITQLNLASVGINSESTGFYNQFVIYVPDGAPAGYGIPQTFIAENPTPEPNSLILFGLGLLVMAFTVKKFNLQRLNNN